MSFPVKLVMKVVAVKAMARPKTMPIPLRIAEPPSAKAKPSSRRCETCAFTVAMLM